MVQPSFPYYYIPTTSLWLIPLGQTYYKHETFYFSSLYAYIVFFHGTVLHFETIDKMAWQQLGWRCLILV